MQYLSAVENEKREPSLSLLKQIAEVIGVPASMLLWEDIGEIHDDTLEGRLKNLLVELASSRMAK